MSLNSVTPVLRSVSVRRTLAVMLVLLLIAGTLPASLTALAEPVYVELTGDLDVYNGTTGTGSTVRTTTIAGHGYIEAVFGTAGWASSNPYNFSNNSNYDYRAAFDSAKGDGAAVGNYFDGATEGHCGIVFKEPQIIARIGYRARQSTDRLNGAILEGSNDDVNYEHIFTLNGSSTGSYTYRTADDGMVCNKAYKYIRLRGTSSLNGALNPHELKLYTFGGPETILESVSLPAIITSDISLPTSIADYSITWVSNTPNSITDEGVVTVPEDKRPADASLTASIENNGELISRTFDILIFPTDPMAKPAVFAYVDANQAAAVGYSMHFAVIKDSAVTPLNFGDGVLFAPADWTTQTLSISEAYLDDYDPDMDSYTYGGKRSLDNPWVFRMADGKYGVVAQQRAYDDTLPAGYEKSLFFWTTENLLDYEYKGKITPADEEVSKPQVEYDGGAYHLTWLSGTEVHEMRTADFVSFTDYTENSTRARELVPSVINGISCAFDITPSQYDYLLKKLVPLTNVAADNRGEISLTSGAGLSLSDLPQTFKAYYSDGSEADMPIKWDESVLSSIKTNISGQYTITGTAAYDQYPYPFIYDRADPDIVFYEDYYYFISTFDTSGSGSESYQQSLRIRRAPTIAELPSADEYTLIPYSSSAPAYKWAPELHMIDGTLSILVAIGQGSASWNRQHASIMTLKEGGNPLLAEDWNTPVTIKRPDGVTQLQTNQNGITLDMTYFEDAGNHYYMWSQRYIRNSSGSTTADLYIAKFDPANPSVLTTPAKVLMRPTYGWERPASSRVQEGPYVLRHDGRMFLTYSGGAVDQTYVVALMEAKQGTDLTDINNWDVMGYPILTSNKVTGQYGPGHNAYVKDEYGRDAIVFHARTTTGGGARHAGVRTVHWAFDGTPVLYMTADRQIKPEYRTYTLTVKVTVDPDIHADAEALTVTNIDDVRGNLTLPVQGLTGSYISWSSSNPSVITPTGEVTRPAYGEPDINVKLTATLTYGLETTTRTLDALVKSMPRGTPYGGYLLGYFLANTVSGENIRMSVSSGNSPTDWTRLMKGGSDILFTSLLGEMGLRDPFIIRSPEGDKFFMIATDLSIGRNGNWTRAQTSGSLYIEVWESTDLVNWSEQRHVKVSPDTAGNTWAPEAYWDDSIGAYVVFWASCLYPEGSSRNSATSNRMMFCTTRDFVTFTEPQVWQDRSIATIDTTVIKEGDMYYRFTKNESGYNANSNPYGKDIFLEKGSNLRDTNLENWELIGNNISRRIWNNGAGSTGYEGPVIFRSNPGDPMGKGFYYMPDNNGGAGYRLAFIPDLDTLSNYNSSAQVTLINWGVSATLHHGTVISVTESERQALLGETYKVPTTISLVINNNIAEATVTAEDGGKVAGSVTFTAGDWTKTVKLEDGKAKADISPVTGLAVIKAEYIPFDQELAASECASDYEAKPHIIEYTDNLTVGCAANILVKLGNPADGLSAEVTVGGVIYKASFGSDGSARIRVPVAINETKLTLRLMDGDVELESKGITMNEMPEGIWSANVETSGSDLRVIFAAAVSAAPKGYAATINGIDAVPVSGGDNILVFKNVALPDNNKIVISGVKFPLYFPSYSFTFSLTYNK